MVDSPVAFTSSSILVSGGGVSGGGGRDDPPGSRIGSASGSLQNDSLLSSSDGSTDADYGFSRPDFGRENLAGTVRPYDRHLFLCYKRPSVWPARVEAAEFDRLPRLLAAAITTRKPHITKRTRLTICEGEDGTESSNGDILIFPDMIRYRRLTHFDVDNFVDEVLVKDNEWLPGTAEALNGSYIFVCAHGSRDRRCGTCGPVIVKKIEEEINSRGLQHNVFVSPCSHIGGHKYAGNVIIFGLNIKSEVTGHWYGYVTPDDVPMLLGQHIGKGKILEHIWRGQMGLSGEDQMKAQRHRLTYGALEEANNSEEFIQTREDFLCCSTTGPEGGCQGIANGTCCQNGTNANEDPETAKDFEREDIYIEGITTTCSRSGTGGRKVCPMPTWFETLEHEDIYAVVSVVAAIASVAVAFSLYRQLK